MLRRRPAVLLLALALSLGLLGVSGAARAQSANDVRVTVLVLPPYSTHLSDYVDQPNRLVVTLTNLTRTPVSLQLAGTLTGDNGVRVQTSAQARSPRPVQLTGLQTRQLDRDELGQLFDENQLTYSGVTVQQMVRGNGLPEGSYTLCVRALDYATLQPRSAENPLGCSRSFLLRSLEPPIIVRPAAEEIVKTQSPQNILFTWTRPAGAPISTEYELRIVEMSDPKRNPNDAFLAGTTPALFERTVSPATTLLYGPADPALIPGRRYAFAVTARDPQGRAVFRNNGRSEVSTFVYGAATKYSDSNSGVVVTPPVKVPGLDKGPVKVAAPPVKATGPAVNPAAYQPVFYTTQITTQIVGFFPDDPAQKTHLFANKSVKLVIDYEAIYSDGSRSSNEYAAHRMPDYHKVLATGTTDGSGNLQLAYLTQINYRTTADTTFAADNTEVPTMFHGRLQRGLRILVNSQYYTSPDQIFRPPTGANVAFTLQQQRAGVRSVSLNVRLQPRQFSQAEVQENGQAKQDPLLNVPVYVLRKWKPTAFPPEGNAPDMASPLAGYVVVSKAAASQLTTIDGVKYATATFNMLLPGLNPSTPYYLYADVRSEAMGDNRAVAYTCPVLPWSIGNEPSPDHTPGSYYGKKVEGKQRDLYNLQNPWLVGNGQWNLSHAVDVANLSLEPQAPRVVGNTYRGENASKALPGVTALLMRINDDWTGGTAERYGYSREKDGFFVFTKVHPDVNAAGKITGPSKRWVTLQKDGYATLVTPMLNNGKPLAFGQQLDLGKMLLQPLGRVKGEIVGDVVLESVTISGVEAPGKGKKKGQNIQVTTSKGAVLTPPARVWVGEGLEQVLNKPKAESGGPRSFDVAAPTGKQMLHVEPYDPNYFTTDTLINVTGDKFDVGRVRLVHKLHRLHIIVYESDKKGGTVTSVGGVQPIGQGGSMAGTGVSGTSATSYTPASGSGSKNSGPAPTTTTTVGAAGGVGGNFQGGAGNVNSALGTGVNSATVNQLAASVLPGWGTAIKNVKVEVLALSEPTETTTDVGGSATLRFASSGTKFTLRLTPLDGSYQAREVTLVNNLSRQDSVYHLALEPALVVRGQVRLGKQPIAGARVFVDWSGLKVETFSDANGNYELGGVPAKQPLTLRATRTGSSYVGAELKRTFNTATDGVDLLISQYNKLDLSRLLGVPVEVETLEDKAGVVSITGAFVRLRGTAGLAPADTALRLPFGTVAVKGGAEKNVKGIPYMMPAAGNSVTSSLTKAEVVVNGKLPGFLVKSDGLRVVGGANGQPGAVRGAVYLPVTQFKDQSISFGATDKVYLAHPTAPAPDRLLYPALVPAGTEAAPAPRWQPVTADNKALTYKLYNFPAEAATAASALGHDTLRLATTLHPQPAGLATPLSVNVGVISALPAKVLPVSGTAKLSLPLESWTLESSKFTLSKNQGLYLASGTLHLGAITDAAHDVAFEELTILPASLSQASFNLSSLKLGGVGTLAVVKEAKALLAFDAGQKHWSLDVLRPDQTGAAVASLSGLPDAAGSVDLRLLTFFANQTQAAQLIDNSPALTLNQVVSFRPVTMVVGQDNLQLGGTINLNIPQLGEQDGKLTIVRENQQPKLLVTMPDMQFQTGPLVVKLPGLNYQRLATGGVSFEGTAEEPGVVKFNVKLYHTPDSTALGLKPQQKFELAQGGGYLDNVRGWMRPSGGQWPLLTFGGDVKNANGLSGVLSLSVHGDIMSENQQITVKNVPTPFGDMQLTFDIPKKRLVGYLPFEKDMGGGTKVHGSANLLADPSGWMMLSAGEMEKSNPALQGAAMLMVGSHALEPEIQEQFQKFSYFYQTKGTMPPSFPKTVEGFYFEGKIGMPVPIIPSFDVDLIVISGKLESVMGGDMRMGMNFSNGTEFGIGQSVFLDVKAGVGGTAIIVCGGVEGGVHADLSADGKVNVSSGDWSIAGDASVKLTATAYGGYGVCDSDCSWFTCDKHEKSVDLTVGAKIGVSNAGTDYSVYLK
ncbi:hypothetical protein [Hymenobacter chitinivorans]|uniref:hypothetical protein n=1 Tax=Hymenobacter chitinivorans TaxID=89969 RepID=UPI001475029E|nr:hypothetical protein [Hymenobacter chitinivorans]